MLKVLEVGSQRERPYGWTVVDRETGFDATYVPYDIEDNSYDAIYSEHFIEHMHRFEGVRFFEECMRILKPGGVLRTAWPSGDFCDWLIYEAEDNHEYILEYIDYWHKLVAQHTNMEIYFPGPNPKRSDKENVIRNVLYQNGEHRHLWYVQDMMNTLESIGFVDVTEQLTSKSYCPVLRGAEDMRHMLRRIETSIVECRKPYVA